MSADRASGRSIQACLECRRSKLKCDGMFRADSTCSRCKRRGKQCSWSVTLPGAPGALGDGASTASDETSEVKVGESSSMGAGMAAPAFAPPMHSGHRPTQSYGDASFMDDPHRRLPSGPHLSAMPNSYAGTNGALPASLSMPLQMPAAVPNLSSIGASSTLRSPPIFSLPMGSGSMTAGTTLPPLRSNPSYGAHLHSPLSAASPRSSGLTPPANSAYRRPMWASGLAEHATPPRYQTTSWSRRRSRSPDAKRERHPSSETSSSSRGERHRTGSVSTAPLQHLREVALISPVTAPESGSTSKTSDRTDASSDFKSPEQMRLDAAQEEMRALQMKQGWDKKRLDAASGERRSFFERAVAPEPEALQRLDPLETGLLNEEDVERLFALFFDSINTQHCLLDPERDSHVEVRKKSRALFIVICAAASSCDDHPRSRDAMKTLLQNMDEAASHLILSNSKSVEVIKAIILSFLYTQKPSRVADDRCWLLVDTAVRTASELGLGHRLRHPQADIASTDTHAIRSAERAWAIAIIMQRSLGTFTGMWALNKLDVNWDKLDAWCNCELTIPGDVQLVAYLYLRRIEHHTRSQFELIDQEKFLTLESVRVSFNALFDNWRAQWVDHPKIVSVRFTHDFLLTIGLHIQLLLNVTALRLSQGRVPQDIARQAPANLQDFCVDLAAGLCEHFVANFQERAHMLCRNIVSMVTWSALALLQMDFERGHLLALRVSLLLAGNADDDLHHTNFPAFYGRWLLSLVNDLAAEQSVRRTDPTATTGLKTSALQRVASNTGSVGSAAVLGSEARNALIGSGVGQTGTSGFGSSLLNSAAGSPAGQAPGQALPNGLSVSGGTPSKVNNVNGSVGDRGGIAASMGADKLLSTMAAPLSTDPFNEAWLNQFLDSLAPASWPTAEDAAALSGSAYLY